MEEINRSGKDGSVDDFIEAIEDPQRKEDSLVLRALMWMQGF